MYIINKTHQAQSFGVREGEQGIKQLVLHYTELNFDDSLEILTKGQVSSHYLVPESAVNGKNIIYSLVDDALLAKHAGASHWQNIDALNHTSVGIEIVNLAFKKDNQESDHQAGRQWLSFTEHQIALTLELAKDLVKKYDIADTCVVGHSDIAPNRKIDPGPLFPWKYFAENGVGAWYDQKEVDKTIQFLAGKQYLLNIIWVQKCLIRYGYKLEANGVMDRVTKEALTAFQMHFRSSNYNGLIDPETSAILNSLIKKYFPLERDLELSAYITEI